MKRSYTETSFYNLKIIASVDELIEVIGKPRYSQNDGREITLEWDYTSENGGVFTIYG